MITCTITFKITSDHDKAFWIDSQRNMTIKGKLSLENGFVLEQVNIIDITQVGKYKSMIIFGYHQRHEHTNSSQILPIKIFGNQIEPILHIKPTNGLYFSRFVSLYLQMHIFSI